MSIEVMTRVWKHSKFKGSALLSMLALADDANEQGFCWPGMPRIAKKTRLSVRQTQTLVHAMGNTPELYIPPDATSEYGTHFYFVLTGMSNNEITQTLQKHLNISPIAAMSLADSILARGEIIAPGEKITGRGEKSSKKRSKTSPDPLSYPSDIDPLESTVVPPQPHMAPICYFLQGALGGSLGRPPLPPGYTLSQYSALSKRYYEHAAPGLNSQLDVAGKLYAAYLEAESVSPTWAVGEVTTAMTLCLDMANHKVTPTSLAASLETFRRSQKDDYYAQRAVSLKMIATVAIRDIKAAADSANQSATEDDLVDDPRHPGAKISQTKLAEYVQEQQIAARKQAAILGKEG